MCQFSESENIISFYLIMILILKVDIYQYYQKSEKSANIIHCFSIPFGRLFVTSFIIIATPIKKIFKVA